MFDLVSANNFQLMIQAVFLTFLLYVVVVRIRECWGIRKEFYEFAKETNRKDHLFQFWLKHSGKRIHYCDLIADLFVAAVICYFVI